MLSCPMFPSVYHCPARPLNLEARGGQSVVKISVRGLLIQNVPSYISFWCHFVLAVTRKGFAGRWPPKFGGPAEAKSVVKISVRYLLLWNLLSYTSLWCHFVLAVSRQGFAERSPSEFEQHTRWNPRCVVQGGGRQRRIKTGKPGQL
jgi:hypothetical protein